MWSFEHGLKGSQIHGFGDALFFSTVQVLTVSSSFKNPVTHAGQIVDVILESWAIFVVTAVAGSFSSFFASGARGMSRRCSQGRSLRGVRPFGRSNRGCCGRQARSRPADRRPQRVEVKIGLVERVDECAETGWSFGHPRRSRSFGRRWRLDPGCELKPQEAGHELVRRKRFERAEALHERLLCLCPLVASPGRFKEGQAQEPIAVKSREGQ